MPEEAFEHDGDADSCNPSISDAVTVLEHNLTANDPIGIRNRAMHDALRSLELLPNVLEYRRTGSRPEWDNYKHTPTPAEIRALRVQSIVTPHRPFLDMTADIGAVEELIAELQSLQWNSLNPEAQSDNDWYAAQHGTDDRDAAA
jgi:hypothetical protein